MVPVATLNLAGLSTADFESAALFDATGGADRIIFEFIDVVTTTDAQDIYGRIKEGGAYKSGASDYRWGTRFGYDDNTTMTGQNFSGDTKMHVSFLSNVSNVATEPFCALVTFYNPAGTAARKKMRSDVVQTDSALADRVQAGFAYGHYVGTNAALQGVRFLPSGAGTFASGRINAYRVPRPS